METKKQRQMSEAFCNSAFLALSGGFQDAYTYNTRDEVFSNAQTGNVVLMSQHFMTGEWMAGVRYLLPLVAFTLGVFIAEQIQYHYKDARRLHWRQGIILAEILILFAVGFIPKEFNMVATVLVSFACAMQVQTFREGQRICVCEYDVYWKLKKRNSGTVRLFKRKKPEQFRQSMHYFAIIFIFAVGAELVETSPLILAST